MGSPVTNPKTAPPNTYPVKYGFCVSVEIVRAYGIAKIVVHAPWYVRKWVDLPFSYDSEQFTDAEILRDHTLNTKLQQMYG